MKLSSEPIFSLFDLTSTDDITRISIKVSAAGNCYITDDSRNLYNGFILAKNRLNHTRCVLSFYPSSSNAGKYIPRPEFQIVKNSDNSIAESNKGNDRTRRVDFNDDEHGLSNFWKMIQFLSEFKDIVDLGEFEHEFRVMKQDDIIQNIKTSENREETLISISEGAGVPVEDLAMYKEIKDRTRHLEIFNRLMKDEDGYIEKYKLHHGIRKSGDEAAWHHFLKEHRWVFGLNLDIRFIEDFADEQHVGNPSSQNTGNPTVDMTGYTDYTVLIELKTPKAKIFTKEKSDKARTNTWSFTEDFIEGFSQCLGQKFDWDKNEPSKRFVKDKQLLDKREIRTLDPKVIFLFGNKDGELPRKSVDDDNIIKRDTLERFMRNNRNIEFISYDELFNRAEYIVTGQTNARKYA